MIDNLTTFSAYTRLGAYKLLTQMTMITTDDAEEAAWDSIITWLGRLRTLEGVPFPYIVPHEEMLPNDSIRFFHIDRNWIDAMIDGALSTGVLDSRGALADVDPEKRRELYLELMEALNKQELILNPFRTALAAHDKARALNKSVFENAVSQANQNYTQRIQQEIAKFPEQQRSMSDAMKGVAQGEVSTTSKVSSEGKHADHQISKSTKYIAGNTLENIQSSTQSSPFISEINHESFSEKMRISRDIQGELATQIGGILSQMTMIRGGLLTGFLLRSTIVRDYPGLEIQAYDAPECVGEKREEGFDEGRAVELIRVARLSETILLCIFNGVPTHLRIKEPSEGLRLGLEKQDKGGGKIDPRLFVKYKNRDGFIEEGKTIPIRVRAGTGDISVLRMSDFMIGNAWNNERIEQNLDADENPNLVKGGYVATQLMQFPYQQDFVYDSIRQQPIIGSQDESIVNVEAIRVENSSVVNRPSSGGEQHG
ncbi:MAG: hypothetical protein O3A74_05720 [archaeon]|jgi:hypothetical protein|nr:hypothetical protein [archaeon]MDA0842714.1 hypothetical protein [archaeon]